MKNRKGLGFCLALGVGLGVLGGGYACSDDDDDNNGDVNVAVNPLKGGPIAVNDQQDTVAVANKASNTVSLFKAGGIEDSDGLRAEIDVGEEPSSVAWAPDGKTLYVVNRVSQTVSVIEDADTDDPTKVADDITVGAEPGNIVLSPTGKTAYVSNFADGTVSMIDTATREVTGTKTGLGKAPYGLCMTNDGDQDDSDESLFVTDFFSTPINGQKEATDTNRMGRVYELKLSDMSVELHELAPVENIANRIQFLEDNNEDSDAFANQLYSCVVEREKNRVFITAVNASPEPARNLNFQPTGPTRTDFHQNVHGTIYALNTDDDTVRSYLINEFIDDFETTDLKRFAAVAADIGCTNDICYVAVPSADAVLRFDFSSETVRFGGAGKQFIDSSENAKPGDSPMGIAVIDGNAFVYNEVNRSVARIDLASQALADEAASSDQPDENSEAEKALTGQRFFNTGLGVWSNAAWVSCLSCHPFGLTDNVTWSFPTGPRQTVDMSPSFDKTGAHQRILNWTAIFDEVCDFEINTRNVAGGTGAIVTADSIADRINLAEPSVEGNGGSPNDFNQGSTCELSESAAANSLRTEEWREIESYAKTIRAPRGRSASEAVLTLGEQVFRDGNCHNCHGGPLWTVAERYYTPELDETIKDLSIGDVGSVSASVLGTDTAGNTIDAASDLLTNDANGGALRHTCTVRRVGTFDVDGPQGIGADEVREDETKAAQGIGGYNVPSLLGVNLGAPYLHNGAAASLEELFSDDAFIEHRQSGNANFAPEGDDLAALVAFVRSIDDETEVIDIPAGQQICPDNVTPQAP